MNTQTNQRSNDLQFITSHRLGDTVFSQIQSENLFPESISEMLLLNIDGGVFKMRTSFTFHNRCPYSLARYSLRLPCMIPLTINTRVT